MEVELLNENIGNKIKNLRNLNGLTQQELADRTELTKGYISQLERGQVMPSVVTLLELIECLGTTASDFFKVTVEEQVVYTEENYYEKIDENNNSIQWIVPTAQSNQMEPLLVQLQPHQVLSEDKPHSGEEFGYVIEGEITVHHGDGAYPVKAGDSFYYTSNEKHYIENKKAVAAKFVWVSTPPSF